MEKRNIKEDIKNFQNWGMESNKKQLDIFTGLYIIEKENIWTDPEYYEGTKLKKYCEGAFKDLLSDVFKFGSIRYSNMKTMKTEILNWKELYIRYGWEHNMACLLKRTQKEREYIIGQVNSGDTRDMQTIWREKYPKKQDKVIKINDGWKSKYLQAKKEIVELKRVTTEEISKWKMKHAELEQYLKQIIDVAKIVNINEDQKQCQSQK